MRSYKPLTEQQKARKKETSSAWYLANKERKARTQKAWVAANRERFYKKSKDSYLRCTYGISSQQLSELIEDTAGLCFICCAPMASGSDTHIDHDHATGKVRGLLHARCNMAIGALGDSQLITMSAAQYLGVNT